MVDSFWFLFPVANYDTLPYDPSLPDSQNFAMSCQGCDVEFPSVGFGINVAGITVTESDRWMR